MVRSRSETNLNRIFFDLCTTPEIRRKHGDQTNQQRQYHPPLPRLQPIKSNSCSNINELSDNLNESNSSFTSDQTDEQHEPVNRTTLQPPKSSTAIPLVPMESTGFTVQATAVTAQRSLKLFETSSTNNTKKSPIEESTPKEKKNSTAVPLTQIPSQDWKQQDFTNRLQNRLKSRGHLRKFFLS
jgi:hypothetical protein